MSIAVTVMPKEAADILREQEESEELVEERASKRQKVDHKTEANETSEEAETPPDYVPNEPENLFDSTAIVFDPERNRYLHFDPDCLVASDALPTKNSTIVNWRYRVTKPDGTSTLIKLVLRTIDMGAPFGWSLYKGDPKSATLDLSFYGYEDDPAMIQFYNEMKKVDDAMFEVLFNNETTRRKLWPQSYRKPKEVTDEVHKAMVRANFCGCTDIPPETEVKDENGNPKIDEKTGQPELKQYAPKLRLKPQYLGNNKYKFVLKQGNRYDARIVDPLVALHKEKGGSVPKGAYLYHASYSSTKDNTVRTKNILLQGLLTEDNGVQIDGFAF